MFCDEKTGTADVVVFSFSNAASETARTLVETATKHTQARKKCFARNALRMDSCGGREVYLACSELSASVLPFLNSSNGFNKQRRRLRMTQIGSRRVANAVGA